MIARNRRPLIGVTGPNRRGWARRRLTHFAVRRAGGWPIALTPERVANRDRLDGLILTGGTDIHPELYGQPNVAARHPNLARDRLEHELVRWAVDTGKPTLGICRGMQLMAVALGGTLHQEASTTYPGFKPVKGFYRQLTFRRPVQVIKKGWVSSVLGKSAKDSFSQ